MAEPTSSILLIDADSGVRGRLRSYLRKEGYRVFECDTGEEGLRIASEHRPSLIILDSVLPGTDGRGILRRFKENRLTRDTPVVVLTAADDQDLKLDLFREGAADFLTKPVGKEEVAVRVNALIRTVEANRLRVLIEFAGATAHELRQPLCILGGYVEYLGSVLEGADKEKAAPVLDEMRKGVARMTDLIARMEGMQEYRTRSYWGDTRIVDLNVDEPTEE
ncbi:MAG: response regulator [Kiritimatiellaeota bacterium]|nr:response regulator [Kiritimatiellota bacterium]